MKKLGKPLSLLLALTLCVALSVPALAGGRDFAFDIGISYTLDTSQYDYGAYVEEVYGSEAFFALPNYETYWAQLDAVYSNWLNSLNSVYTGMHSAKNALLPQRHEMHWVTVAQPVVLSLSDGSTITLSQWDSYTSTFVSDVTFDHYGGEDKVPGVVSVQSVPKLSGFATTAIRWNENTRSISVRVVPEAGFPPIGYDSVNIPLPKKAPTTDSVFRPAPALVAAPNASTVLVNGVNVAFDAYTINQNNYFKLRDLAYILNGTEKQFEVTWDGENNAILLISGQPYTAVGGEMTGKGAGNKNPVPTSSKIMLNGQEVVFTAYTIEGNNYFKLRDVGATFDFGVDWDGANNTIVIDTSKGYIPG